MDIRERILARPDLDSLRANRDITALAAALNADAPMIIVEILSYPDPVVEQVLAPLMVTQEQVDEDMYHPDGTEK